jgi:hypothetical protein
MKKYLLLILFAVSVSAAEEAPLGIVNQAERQAMSSEDFKIMAYVVIPAWSLAALSLYAAFKLLYP